MEIINKEYNVEEMQIVGISHKLKEILTRILLKIRNHILYTKALLINILYTCIELFVSNKLLLP